MGTLDNMHIFLPTNSFLCTNTDSEQQLTDPLYTDNVVVKALGWNKVCVSS